MNFLKAFSASTVLFAVTTLPASAGGLIDISKGISYWVNDGNPKLAVTDGVRATVIIDSRNEYPVKGEVYGEEDEYKISPEQKKTAAKMLNVCKAGVGGSWETKFTYRYYVGSSLWLCNR